MQSIIATFLGLIAAVTILLMAKVAGVGMIVGIGLWILALWLGVFITVFLCPKKNATWLKSHLPAWIVATIIIVLGALVYGAIFAIFPLWIKIPIAFLMSAGTMCMIWIAPKLSKRPSV
ncbi:hypothetical protein [Hirschia baltica]|uniref:Uncharacterized protein n=1 Tax=Hirschia baltica (strain ATCC 49814 / DSM 5838 / IFAM 1418) TaxID=582402 RepID=C6XMK6_HIRBI|nr:hypothetical protein [Hirschia baltica]ACT59920.1 hypothetical protein Hbal_2240 [Hirschia baltica ATCC 49814]